MRHSILFRNAALALLVTFAVDARAVTMSWSPVGNPGNANNPADGDDITPGIQNFGAVGYAYKIGTYDVTNSQYVDFLNAKDASGANALDLYHSLMSNPVFNGGINFNSGAANGNKYSVISGNGNHPVTLVTWYDTIRFANWMNNGQGNGDTETGAYTLLGGTATPSNAATVARNAGATVFLPNGNEWYKAAYYNPATSSYFQYPTGSNTTPTASSPTALPNHANFFSGGSEFLADVGAYTGTTSPYGAYDMGGNVWQWNEALIGSNRDARGGFYGSTSVDLLSSYRGATFDPEVSLADIGFRVAETPEPSSLVLAALGFIGIAWRLRRR